MAFAAVMDLFTMTIPNRISILLVASFLVVAPLTGLGWEPFMWHLLTGSAVLALGILLFALGLVGGGDAKLLAAASLWLGFEHLGEYIVVVAVMGGLLSIVLLIYRAAVLPRWILSQPWAMRLHNKKEGIPYGLALAGAALWVFPTTAWYNAVLM
jgi:prepilin peptidase CpaA